MRPLYYLLILLCLVNPPLVNAAHSLGHVTTNAGQETTNLSEELSQSRVSLLPCHTNDEEPDIPHLDQSKLLNSSTEFTKSLSSCCDDQSQCNDKLCHSVGIGLQQTSFSHPSAMPGYVFSPSLYTSYIYPQIGPPPIF